MHRWSILPTFRSNSPNPYASAGSSPVCRMNESRAGMLRSGDCARCNARQAMRSGMLLVASGITPRHLDLLVVSSAF